MSDTAAIAPTLLRATIEFLRRHAPFDRMEPPHLEFMVEHLRLGYYPKDALIISPEQGVAGRFYVIKQGSVIGEQAAGRKENEGANWQLTEGECFPLGALLAERPVASIYRAAADTFCYELGADLFSRLIALSPPFHDFCTRRIANLLEQSKRVIQAQYSQRSSDRQSLDSPLGSLVQRAPVTCPAGTSIKQALTTMQRHSIGSIVVTGADGEPVGMFTLHDLLNRVALPGRDTEQPIGSVMTASPIALPAHGFAHDAALAMARHGIRHVLVVEDRRLVGVISEQDLFSLQRVGLTQISSAIHNASSHESLHQSGRDIRQLAHNMLAQGVSAEYLTQIISTLNDLLTSRVIALEMRTAGMGHAPFCWIALGSEGRLEQTLSTDQDNGIIFADAEGDPQTVRDRLLPIAERINRQLDRCGFPLCKGKVMASNPEWCLSLTEWRGRFARWLDQCDPEALLNATIFFDFRPVYGQTELAQALRAWLGPRAAGNRRFLYQMTQNALGNRPPLGLVGDFLFSENASQAHAIDLKLKGSTPFVDAARIYALATETPYTNTPQRLRHVAGLLGIAPGEAEAWVEAFHFIQLLRLQQQHLREAEPIESANLLDPDRLNDLDRRILKEALRQARKLQARLAFRYRI